MLLSKILIVEDDKSIALLTESMLKELGYNVVGVATTSDQALKFAGKFNPDLILMDIIIQGNVDGIQTAQIVKDEFGIPVVFITSSSNNKTIEKAKVTEPYGYLIKPFEIKELKGTIQIAIHKKEMEAKLKESELWYKSILSSIGDGVIATDEFHKIKFVNNVAENLLGYYSEELIGELLEDKLKIIQDTSSEALIVFSKGKSDQKKNDYLNSKILINKFNEEIYVEEKRSIIRSEDGNVIGKVITLSDITNKRNAQLEALSSRDFYLNILEKFPVLIWRTNEIGDFNYFNNKWNEYTGRSLDSQVFQGWYDGIHDEDKSKFISLFEKSLKCQKSFVTEFRLLNGDNEYHWFICIGNPHYGINNEFSGFIAACFDITDRKIIEEELRNAKDASEKANIFKRNIISNVSHEIRTPLNGILGLTDLLLDSKLNSEQTEFIEMIKQCGATLLELLNNLLDFSKIEEGKNELELEPFHFPKLITEIIAPYETLLKRRNIRFKVEIDNLIPEEIIGDSEKIKQIINNLLSNSSKFTQSGEISLGIKLKEFLENKNNDKENLILHLTVSDTGIGIPEEKQNEIFENFTQADGSFTRKYSGAGLGLGIIKKLIESMDGKIWFDSKVDVGSNFHVLVNLKAKKVEIELSN